MNEEKNSKQLEISKVKEEILKQFSDPNYKKMKANKILKAFGEDNSKNFVIIMKALNELENEFIIAHDEQGRFDFIEKFNLAVGTILIKEVGYGFVSTKQSASDIFIPKDKTLYALTGDKVLVHCDYTDPKGPSGEVIEIIERKNTYLYGVLIKRGKHFFVIPDDYRYNIAIFIPKDSLSDAEVGQMVKVFITKYYRDGKIDGEIVATLGEETAPGVDITAVVMSSGVHTEFPDDVLAEANRFGDEISSAALQNRRDIRDKRVVTIDGVDAKDFDDAVGLEILPNGNYHLGVYIADVSYYVRELSAIDNEAFIRSFSIYLPDRVYPMLPEQLSNGLCSLKPQVDRLVVGCEMELDKDGKVLSYDIFPAVIKSTARLTYDEVNDLFHNKETSIKPDVASMLLEMNNLAKVLQNSRYERGALDFDVAEAKAILDENGKVKDLVLREREDAEKLIEEFMILANETVAQAMEWLEAPFIYRVHEDPKEEKITQFKAISKLLGYNIPDKAPSIHVKALQIILEQTKDKPFGTLLHNLLLRSMAKAKYDAVNIGHFGLASKCYTHFTSPIRRYPDLMVHRLIKKYYFHADVGSSENDEIKIAMVAERASEQERVVENIERDVLDMKKCEYMENYIGATFKGVISSVVSWGFYVELPNTIEGLVSSENIGPDHYSFNEVLLEWYGKFSDRHYRIGDEVTVVVLAASKTKRQIDFAISLK